MAKLKYVGAVLLAVWGLTLGGCARTGGMLVPQFSRPAVDFNKGVYHEVKRGETLWRISKTYGVDISGLAQVNHIRDYNQLRVGQLVFVPHVAQKKQIQKPINLKNHRAVKSESIFFRPVEHGRVDILFGEDKGRVKNKGIDIRAKAGSAVSASKSGVVTFNDSLRGMGQMIVIDHQDGYSTIYAHLFKSFVKEGLAVTQGQKIGTLGSSKEMIQPVLHFEVRKHGKAIDPISVLPRY